MEWLGILNAVILSFLVAEFIRTLFFTRKWQFRFNKNPSPIVHWKKALVVLLLFVFVFPIINWLFVNYISRALSYLGFYQVSLFFLFLPITYLWVDKWILGSEWDKSDALPIGIIFLDLLLTLVL